MAAKPVTTEPRQKTSKELKMNGNNLGANEFTIEELEALFNSDTQQTTPAATDDTTDVQDGDDTTVTKETKSNDVENTKAFATRLKQSTEKARKEERESIAKSFGYESYDEMIKARERKTYEDKGLDPDEVSPIVDELVKQKLDSDPRMIELAEFRKKQVEEFGRKELAEITKLTNGKVTNFNQLSKNVLDAWQKTGSLKSAYLQVEGENLINTMRSEQSKGSAEHLGNVNGSSPTHNDERPLTDKEKQMWKFFNPNISDEELNKKTIKK